MTRYYHVTDHAAAILRGGFRDSTSSSFPWVSGVYLSDQPLDVNEGAVCDQVLVVDLSDDTPLDAYEIIESGKPYREWVVPAAIVNTHGQVRQIAEWDSE